MECSSWSLDVNKRIGYLWVLSFDIPAFLDSKLQKNGGKRTGATSGPYSDRYFW